MDATTHSRWLLDTRRFWDADTEFQAKYRRICSSPDFDATTDERTLQRLWKEETERAIKLLLRGIPIEPGWTCLEIGCGIGRLLKPIAGRCKQVIGVDLSEKMVRWSHTYLEGVPNAEVRLNNGCALPGVPDASIDFVYSHLAFQHITLFEVVDAYVNEIARVLRPGGYCRIQNWRDAPTPMREALKDMIRPLLGRQRYRSSRCWIWHEGSQVKFGGVVFHPRRWRRLLRSHGLIPVSTELGEGHDYWMWTTSVRRGGAMP
ncbi:MAG: class I SAM-dependent methyltransferase [Phycisphaerae bacterium]